MKKAFTFLLCPLLTFHFSLFTVHCSFAQQSVIQLPATGQTTSYYTGDDGDLQKGVPIPATRFDDNGNGTVTDLFTGLMWIMDGNLIATKDPDFDQDRISGDGDINWKTAMDYIEILNSENYLGFSDWRVPNVIELRSLVYLGIPEIALPPDHPFTNLQNLYWSSTTSEETRSLASCVLLKEHFAHSNIIHPAGEIENFLKNPNVYMANYWEYYLIPVRGVSASGTIELPESGQLYTFYQGDDGGLQEGVEWPTPRLVDHNNETVTDRLTGLMWTQDANLMLTKDPDFDTTPYVDGAVPWITALEYINLLNTENYLGFSDWRMPNRNEMMSLVDCSRTRPSIPERFPFTNIAGYNFEYAYWTSSTRADETDQAWMIRLTDGTMGGGNKLAYEKTKDWHVWPVRTDTQPLSSSSITGTITLDGNPYPRAEIEITGPINGFTRTNLNGEFEFNFLPDGNYSVTPTHKYAVFFPETCAVFLDNSTETCNFTSAYKRAYGWEDIGENLFPLGNAAGGCLSDLWFIGNEGWITNSCYFNEIYYTTDGGETWEVQEPLVPCNAIYMLSDEIGYAGGESGFLCNTTDGGANWNFFGLAPSTILSIGFSPDESMGWCGGSDGYLSEVTSSGLISQFTNYTDWNAISFGSSNFGWAVSCFGRKMIFENGTWTYIGGAQYFPCFSDIQFNDSQSAWMGYGGKLIRLKDELFQTFYEDTLSSISGVFTQSEDSIWAVTTAGDVLLTAGGGNDTVHFSVDNISDGWLTDIFASDPHHAWAIGNNGSVYRYGVLEGFPSNQANILDVVIEEMEQPAVINNSSMTVQLSIEAGADITNLIPEIFISAGATIYPPSGMIQDFTNPIVYTVTSENGQLVNAWTISCDISIGIKTNPHFAVSVFPNPANNIIYLKVNQEGNHNGWIEHNTIKIQLFDLYGSSCSSQKAISPGQGTYEIDVSQLKSGVYFCQIIAGNFNSTKKIIIQK